MSDYTNHRVIMFGQYERAGFTVAGGYGHGDGLNQLYNPHGVCVDEVKLSASAGMAAKMAGRARRGGE